MLRRPLLTNIGVICYQYHYPSLPTDIILLTLTSTYLAHALFTLASISTTPQAVDALSSSLTIPTSFSFLTWVPSISSLPVKQTDAMLTRIYSAIKKLCSASTSSTSLTAKTKATHPSPNPERVFQLRMYALCCLCHTSRGTVESGTFWEQVTRSAVALVKAGQSLFPEVEEKVTNLVLPEYAEMLACAQKREDSLSFLEGKGFVGFCEDWMAFAKRVRSISSSLWWTHSARTARLEISVPLRGLESWWSMMSPSRPQARSPNRWEGRKHKIAIPWQRKLHGYVQNSHRLQPC